MFIGRALALPVFSIALGLASGAFSPGVACAQTPTTAVEDDPEPQGPAATQEAIDDRRAESRKRRKSVVIPNRPGGEADVGDREETDEERDAREQKEVEREHDREREEADEGGGGGTNWRAVGIGLTVSGLIVGLGGGALGVAGGVTGDQPTQIAAACVGLTGSALAVAGLIIALTAPPSGPPPVARMLPSVRLNVGPTAASLFVSF